ncbi:MAG: type II secretion system minor pseudopilin GspJ [Gammaproteobacteria bacterium]|nr:type II secretion system minor pseudopilin GspJ [Gammaproteobacteria bacterium]
MNRRPDGFTLLELIVVIGIFAVMAAMAYGGLRSVLNARGRIEASLARTAAFQKAYWVMRDDFINADARPITDGDGQRKPALLYVPLDRRLGFTRGGWGNPTDLPRSTLQRVGYVFDYDKQQLLRRTWPVLDRAPQTQPVDTLLLDRISQVHWRFLDANGQWHDVWPDTGAVQTRSAGDAPPPQAVELQFTARDWGQIRWMFSYGIGTGGVSPPASVPPPPASPPLQPAPGLSNPQQPNGG